MIANSPNDSRGSSVLKVVLGSVVVVVVVVLVVAALVLVALLVLVLE